MKPFNLEEAKAGKPFGNKKLGKAKAIYFIPDEFEVEYPVCVLYKDGEVRTYTKEGVFNAINPLDAEYNLFMLPEEKHEWWNVCGNGFASWYTSKESALIAAEAHPCFLATIHIVKDESGKTIKKEIVE